MAPWILAHTNGLDELVVLASGMALALAVRLLIAHRRTSDVTSSRPRFLVETRRMVVAWRMG